MTFKGFALEAIQDVRGYVSSKRLLAFGSFVVVLVITAANMIWGFKIEETIFNFFKDTILVTVGLSGAEQFTKFIPDPTKDDAPSP